jgi:hypothetical protein
MVVLASTAFMAISKEKPVDKLSLKGNSSMLNGLDR